MEADADPSASIAFEIAKCYPDADPALVHKICHLSHFHLKIIKDSGCLADRISSPEARENFFRYISRLDEKKVESPEAKESRRANRLRLFDSTYLSPLSRILVRKEHVRIFFTALMNLASSFQQIIKENFPLCLEERPPEEPTKPQTLMQYCVICCGNRPPPVTQVSSLRLKGKELGDFCTVINSIRRKRPGRQNRRLGEYNEKQLKARYLCSHHFMSGLINESREVCAPRVAPEIRQQRFQEYFQNLKRETAENAITLCSSNLNDMSEYLISIRKKVQDAQVCDLDDKMRESLDAFLNSLHVFRRLSSEKPTLQLLYDTWISDEAFQHDTTFPSIQDFYDFCQQNGFPAIEILIAIFYLSGNTYRDIWARFNSWNFSAQSLRKKAISGLKSLAVLMQKNLKEYRTKEYWTSETKKVTWHYHNLPYTVDATYLYTQSGQNSEILRNTFSLSKDSNLLKILSFTFLTGVPFWISKSYPGHLSDQEIVEREINANPELRDFLEIAPIEIRTNFAPLNPHSRDLEHILIGAPEDMCTGRPIGIYDRGFDEKILMQLGILLAIPSFLQNRLSLSDEEALYSGYLSSYRVVIENYHARVKLFTTLRNRMDLRSAVNYGYEMWLSGTLFRLRNHREMREGPNEDTVPRSSRKKKKKSSSTASSSSLLDCYSDCEDANLQESDDQYSEEDQEEEDQEEDEEEDQEEEDDEEEYDLADDESEREDNHLEYDSSADLDFLPPSDVDGEASGTGSSWESPSSETSETTETNSSSGGSLQSTLRREASSSNVASIGISLDIPHPDQSTLSQSWLPAPLLSRKRPKIMSFSSSNRVTFDSERHRYFIDGNAVPSSYSSLFAATVSPFNPLQKALQMKKKDAAQGLSVADRLSEWKKATEIGTIVHQLLQNWAENRINAPQFKRYPPSVKQPFNAIKQKLMTFLTEWKILGVELMLPDFGAHLCGTADLLLQSRKNLKEFMIVDYKTTGGSESDLRTTHGSPSSLGIANTKLNSYAIQVHLYRLVFLKVLDIRKFLTSLRENTLHFLLDSEADQTTDNNLMGVTVKVGILTPNFFIRCDTPEFKSFPSLAANLIRKNGYINSQIRTAARFCEAHQTMLQSSAFLSDNPFQRETDPRVSYHMQALMDGAFRSMTIFQRRHLVLLPPLTRDDLFYLCEGDRYCSRRDGKTTETRAETVHLGKKFTLRVCVESNSEFFTTYLAATMGSSRGASLKHSLIAFTFRKHSKLGFLSTCDCVRGASSSCAHRARIICYVADQLLPEKSTNRRDSITTLKRIRELGEEATAAKHQHLGPSSSHSSQSVSEHVQKLTQYLSPQTNTGDLTMNMLNEVKTKLKEKAAELQLSEIKWPQMRPNLYDKIVARLYEIHVRIDLKTIEETVAPAPDSPH